MSEMACVGAASPDRSDASELRCCGSGFENDHRQPSSRPSSLLALRSPGPVASPRRGFRRVERRLVLERAAPRALAVQPRSSPPLRPPESARRSARARSGSTAPIRLLLARSFQTPRIEDKGRKLCRCTGSIDSKVKSRRTARTARFECIDRAALSLRELQRNVKAELSAEQRRTSVPAHSELAQARIRLSALGDRFVALAAPLSPPARLSDSRASSTTRLCTAPAPTSTFSTSTTSSFSSPPAARDDLPRPRYDCADRRS